MAESGYPKCGHCAGDDDCAWINYPDLLFEKCNSGEATGYPQRKFSKWRRLVALWVLMTLLSLLMTPGGSYLKLVGMEILVKWKSLFHHIMWMQKIPLEGRVRPSISLQVCARCRMLFFQVCPKNTAQIRAVTVSDLGQCWCNFALLGTCVAYTILSYCTTL